MHNWMTCTCVWPPDTKCYKSKSYSIDVLATLARLAASLELVFLALALTLSLAACPPGP